MGALLRLARLYARHPLTRDARLPAWWRFAAWQVRSRMGGEVIVPWVAGQRLAVRRGMTGATGNIYLGLHEFPNMMLMLHFLRKGDVFLDVGANIGSYTVLAAGACGARTLAFEPDPDTARHLRRNVDINALAERVAVHEIALGDAAGVVRFTTGRDTTNRLADAADPNVRAVRQERLDDVVGDERPSMAKIDVEGAEEQVLQGAERVLACRSLRVVQIETVTRRVADTFASHDFAEVRYDPFTRRLRDAPAGPTIPNAVFVRDRDAVADRLASAAPVEVLGRVI